MDAAALRTRQQEQTGVVETQSTNFGLHLQLLHHHAVLHVDEPQNCVGVRGHEDLGVEGQEGRHWHGRRVREDLQHLPRLDEPEADGLVDGRRDELILQQVEENGSDRASVAGQARMHRNVRVLRRSSIQSLVRFLSELLIGNHCYFHFRSVAAVDNHCAILGCGCQENVVLVRSLLSEADTSNCRLRILKFLNRPQVRVDVLARALALHALRALQRGPEHALVRLAALVGWIGEPRLHAVQERAPTSVLRRHALGA
mmetsp:Transcript_50710/g.107585  ORF Transcript_50710/g.107585 Transcript_50710/m.107585 type:complete len:257 (-) Transcript_50710:3257-4027(-)